MGQSLQHLCGPLLDSLQRIRGSSWGAQNRTQRSRGGLRSAEERGGIPLSSTMLLVLPRAPSAAFAGSCSAGGVPQPPRGLFHRAASQRGGPQHGPGPGLFLPWSGALRFPVFCSVRVPGAHLQPVRAAARPSGVSAPPQPRGSCQRAEGWPCPVPQTLNEGLERPGPSLDPGATLVVTGLRPGLGRGAAPPGLCGGAGFNPPPPPARPAQTSAASRGESWGSRCRSSEDRADSSHRSARVGPAAQPTAEVCRAAPA
ncbi:uncharacterized protein LOC141915753 [Strix aluco]|uniref:uncharacterized protein LOC141915753 n=1 Tax=Strix aluco TaxID=111821 RepID=UPI003DA48255